MDFRLCFISNFQVTEHLNSGVLVYTAFRQVVAMGVNNLIQRHIGNHRGVANSLKLAVVTCLGTLQFDHYQPSLVIQCQQIYAAPGILPIAEFFGDDEQPHLQNDGLVPQ